MNFLVFGIGKLVDSVTDFQKIFLGGLRLLIYALDTYVYGFIINLYGIFKWICSARIVDNSIMNELATRVGFILGLIMFFYISFDFIQILLDPDKISDKDKGPVNIIKKFIIVIILLGTSRYIFDLMFNFQNLLLNDTDGKGSLIERLILPYNIESDNFGKVISAQFMSQFYQITDDDNVEDLSKPYDDYDYNTCYDVAEALPKAIASNGDFTIGKECLLERYTSENGRKWYISFSPFSILVGIFLAWILIMYCISVGMRVVQLALLQIISPATIICYLSPNKENVFTKWLKIYVSTYIDVFIRIAIIDFVILLSGLILDSGMSDSFWTSSPGNIPVGMDRFWISVFMIMALLSFAKKFPDLLKKLLPDKLQSGLSFGIGTQDRAGLGIFGGALAGGITGVIGGGLTGARSGSGVFGKIAGAAGGIVGGAAGGIGRGFSAGFKGKNLREAVINANKNQTSANINYGQRLSAGGSPFVLPGAQMRLNFLENEYADAEDYSKSFGTAKSKADSEVDKHLGNYKVANFMTTDSSGNTQQHSMTLAQLQQAITNDAYDDNTRAEMQLVYNSAHAAARNLAMDDRGAVNAGTATIDFNGGNYSASVSAVGDPNYGVDHNVEIDAHMKKVLRSSHATGATDYEKAKNANSYYEQKVAEKLNDKTYKRRSANVKYGNKK